MKLLKLNGKFATDGREHAKVDDEDFDRLATCNWKIHRSDIVHRRPIFYAVAWHDGRKVSMHMMVMGFPGLLVNHIDGDRLNNQKSNLRLATKAELARHNRPIPGKSSAYKGVSWSKRHSKWKAQICVDGRFFYLGLFDEEEDAALAYDAAALIHHKEFARLNFTPYL